MAIEWQDRDHCVLPSARIACMAARLNHLMGEVRDGYLSRDQAALQIAEVAGYAQAHTIPFSVDLLTLLIAGENGSWESSDWDASDQDC